MGILDGFLGTSWDDPRTSAILGLAGGLMEGSPMKGLLAMQQANSPEVAMKRELLKAQIDETKTQAEQRALAMQQARDAQAFDQRLFANAFPNGLPGSGAASAGMAAGAPVGGGAAPLSQMSTGALLAQLNEDQMLALVKMGKLPESAIKLWETAKFGKDYKQGDFQQFSDGSQKMIPMVKEGLDFKGGRVGVLPGAAEAQTTLTLANELPKTLLQSASTVNLRDNPDGTKTPVASLTENPVLMRLLAGAGLLPQASTAAPSAPASQPNASPSAMRITPDEQRARDAESIRVLQSEIDTEKNPQTKAGLQRELDRVVQAQAGKGFPAPSVQVAQANPGLGYGKTTAQEIADAAAKEKAVQQAKSDVQPTDQRQNSIASGNVMLGLIDRALAHPGLSAGTGLQGVIDPRNYIPGTDAKNFQAVRDQLKGNVFLQAYEGLKGGGQITEVEGAKAENAKARLQTAQSTEEFKNALADLRSVTESALTRAKQSAERAGSPSAFPGDNADAAKGKTVLRTGTLNGRKVIQYSDGTTSYAN